eukprot:scaffold141993_cov29-Tisochrysis_lutea.AAC.1
MPGGGWGCEYESRDATWSVGIGEGMGTGGSPGTRAHGEAAEAVGKQRLSHPRGKGGGGAKGDKGDVGSEVLKPGPYSRR